MLSSDYTIQRKQEPRQKRKQIWIKKETYPNPIFPTLPKELVQEILKNLTLKELTFVRQFNSDGKAHQEKRFIYYAKELGYSGIKYIEAKRYIQEFFDELPYLNLKGLIPQKYFFFNNQILDLEKTAERFKTLEKEDIFNLLTNEKAYASKYPLKRIFSFLCMKAKTLSITAGDNWNEKKEKGFILSAQYGQAKSLVFFLKQRVNINLTLKDGRTALHLAAQNGHTRALRILLKNRVNVNSLNCNHCTPLMLASGYVQNKHKPPNAEIVKILLTKGADPNIAAINGSSPLHFAAQKGYLKIIELLIKKKANINERGAGGSTPLCFACGYGGILFGKPNRSVVELLLTHGADPTILLECGLSALNLAKKHADKSVVELLLTDQQKRLL